MDFKDFVYWLRGWVEMNGGKQPTEAQWKLIVAHLDLCFTRVTPQLSDLEKVTQQYKPIDTTKLPGYDFPSVKTQENIFFC